MSKMTLSDSSQKTRLTTMIGAVPLLAPKLALYTNNLDPTPLNVKADFTEATFGGYPAGGAAITWGAVGLDANGVPCAPGTVTFTATGVPPAENAFGAMLLDSTGALVGAGLFDNPVSFSVAGDQLTVTLLFGIIAATLNPAVGP